MAFGKKEHKFFDTTQKPLALSAKAIINSSERGNTVVDLFGGSGSTMISCEYLKRKARIMELDPKYVHLEICRWMKYTDNTKVYRIRNGKEEVYEIPFEEVYNLPVKDKIS